MMKYETVFELSQNWHLLIYACQFMTSYIIPLSFVILNLESVESGCGKEGEKIKMELKAFFIAFEGLLFGEK